MWTPLRDIRVLDFTRVVAGPFCTMLLGDLGAEVIKVEQPGLGDETRRWGPPFLSGESTYFLWCNRNKKSITLNLKSREGQDLAAQLACRSDVLVENFLPGKLRSLGLGYDSLREMHPRLVYCSITGFGQEGPYRDRPGYDIFIQAMAGVMSVTGDPAGPPTKVGLPISDITTAQFAVGGILAALFAREQTGEGRYLDISLLDSTVAWLANAGSNYLVARETPSRHGNAHPSIVPYQAFPTSDGSVAVAAGSDVQWLRLCDAVGRPDWKGDSRFSTNALRVQHRDILIPMLETVFHSRTTADWMARLEEAGVPAGPVHTIDQVFRDPQVLSRGMLLPVNHPVLGPLQLAGSPFRRASPNMPPCLPPPLLGQHTDDILRDVLGLDDGAIRLHRQAGTI